jgi:nucleotide-binding universal stress UspA family protein
MTDQATGAISRILVPLDGSELAEAALPVAVGLAARLKAEVLLLHVLEHHPPERVHGQPHLTRPDAAEKYLAAIAGRWTRAGVTITTHVHRDPQEDVVGSLSEHAVELHADLAVLVQHGSGGLGRLVFGRIAQQLLRQVTAPVLIVRPDARGSDRGFDCRSVAVALDGSDDAERGLVFAADLARALGATLQLIRVVPTLGSVRRGSSVATTLLPSATAAMLEIEEDEARDYLRRMVQQFGSQLEVVAHLRRGDVVDELVTAVRDGDADVLVISTHGKAGLEGILSGSVAGRILSRLEDPVLLLRRFDRPRT